MKYQHIKYLFKYKAIDSNLLSSLKKGKIYAPVIDQLNDPLESHIYINNSEINEDEMSKLFSKYFEDEISNIDINNKKKMSNKVRNEAIHNIVYDNGFNISKYISPNDNEKMKRIIDSSISQYGVISFTVDNHSLLMWSHYGNSHKGIGLEFERSSANILGKSDKCFPVQYSSFIKEIDYSQNEEIIKEIYKAKSDVWSYEKEWRLIVKEGKQLIDFPGKLKAVYFGLKTSTEDMLKIKSIFRYNIKYYKASVVPNFYKLAYKEIKD
jgi:hypothetical protein